MSEYDSAIRYIFILSFILIIVAYWAGTTQVLGSLTTSTGSLLNTVTGRTSSGAFASYPTNGPTG